MVQAAELWDSLYLRKDEVTELLAFVKERAAHPWVYPFFCTAAHTGAVPADVTIVLPPEWAAGENGNGKRH